ncbi:MAG: sigma-70 family RNA polymerase sigma factor [Anaeromyxobacter sp.]
MLDLDRHLAQIAAGDPDAFAAWVAGAEPALRDALRRFAGAVDTEQVLQEALLRVWQVAGRCTPDGRPNALLRLAHTIARNLALSELRRPGPADAGDGEPPEPAVEPPEPDPLLRRLVRLCLEQLPPQPRKAFLARLQAQGGREDGALAGQVRMSLNTFLQNVTRARKLLARCLGTKGVELEAAP